MKIDNEKLKELFEKSRVRANREHTTIMREKQELQDWIDAQSEKECDIDNIQF